jgi:RNA polymerase primary sigma factor
MSVLAENKLLFDFDRDPTIRSIANLLELGTNQGFLTQDDLLRLIPEAEGDIDYLDQIYLSILRAGIPILEDAAEAVDRQADDPVVNEHKPSSEKVDPLENIEPGDLIELYFSEAARSPLLTREEEVDLSMRIERGFLARQELSETKSLSTAKYQELMLTIDDSWAAINQLITANSRLVISIAKKYKNRGVPFLDLIQEGNIGLMRAAKKFDYKRGFKFSTYATWWIRQAVSRALADQSRTIRIPSHRNDQIAKMFRTQHHLRQKLGRDPEVLEVAEAMAVPTEVVQQLARIAQFTLSLDMPVSFEEDQELGDFIEDNQSPDPDELSIQILLRQHLEQVFALLPPREVRILKLRYGLANGETHTLAEVGTKIGVSRERIRQIEAQALRRLRQPDIQRVLRSYLA